jgi:hypothetical protein
LSLREHPVLALWHDLWTPTVVGGDLDALPAGWPAATTVEWKSGTVVYLCKTTGEAIDSLLLVGEVGGSGENEPHVYFFQHMAHSDALSQGEPKAATSDGSKQKPTLHRMVEKVHAQLDRLLSPSFAATHVLRRAGINRMAQVTLCIAARKLGPIDVKAAGAAVGAPFNVVVFDAEDLSKLAGPPFANTQFFRELLK